MKDGPFQGDLERAVLQAAEERPRRIEIQKEKIQKEKKG
jgi:hypothetical protein